MALLSGPFRAAARGIAAASHQRSLYTFPQRMWRGIALRKLDICPSYLAKGYTQQALQTMPKGPKLNSNLIWKAEHPTNPHLSQSLANAARPAATCTSTRNDAVRLFDQMLNPYAQSTLSSCARPLEDPSAYVAAVSRRAAAQSLVQPATSESTSSEGKRLRYEMDSLVKKRRKKMRKHKLKKFRKRMRSLNRKLGKAG